MSEQVRVEDLEVFRLFRAAMLKFAQAVEQAISNADSQIARAHSWLETEQMTRWQSQLRKRTEAVTAARDAVRQKKLYKDASGRTPSAIEEEKMLARCLVAVEQAAQKIELVRRWLPKLEKEADLYRSGVAHLSGSATGEIPRAVALLDRLAGTLEAYMQIEAPAGGGSEGAAAAPEEEALARGGEAVEEAAPKAESPPAAKAGDAAAAKAEDAAAPPATPAAAPGGKEARDVADGK